MSDIEIIETLFWMLFIVDSSLIYMVIKDLKNEKGIISTLVSTKDPHEVDDTMLAVVLFFAMTFFALNITALNMIFSVI